MLPLNMSEPNNPDVVFMLLLPMPSTVVVAKTTASVKTTGVESLLPCAMENGRLNFSVYGANVSFKLLF